MKYKIYEIVTPAVLKRIDDDGYHPTTVDRMVLEELSVSGVNDEHTTLELALQEIKDHAKELKYLTLTVIPVININYEGEIQ